MAIGIGPCTLHHQTRDQTTSFVHSCETIITATVPYKGDLLLCLFYCKRNGTAILLPTNRRICLTGLPSHRVKINPEILAFFFRYESYIKAYGTKIPPCAYRS